MERIRIYRAALALDNFTVGELAAHCGANVNTVRSLLTTRDRGLFEIVGHKHHDGRGRPAQRFRLRDREAVQALLRAQQRLLSDDQDLIDRAAAPLSLPSVEASSAAPVDDLLLTLGWAESQMLRVTGRKPAEVDELIDLAEEAADEILAARAELLDDGTLTRARLIKLYGRLLRLESRRASVDNTDSSEKMILLLSDGFPNQDESGNVTLPHHFSRRTHWNWSATDDDERDRRRSVALTVLMACPTAAPAASGLLTAPGIYPTALPDLAWTYKPSCAERMYTWVGSQGKHRPELSLLLSDWNEGCDFAEDAVATSSSLLNRIIDGECGGAESLRLIEAAAEPQLDGVGGNPELVVGALRAADSSLRAVGLGARLGAADALNLRLRSQTLIARACYRLPGCERSALAQSYATLTSLEEASDRAGVVRAIRGSNSNVIAESAVSALAILAATLRRANLQPMVRARLVGTCREYLRAYALQSPDPIIYPRTAALAAQGLYLFSEEGKPADRALIQALYELDVAARPQHARGQIARALRDYAYARSMGDRKATEHCAMAALHDLAEVPLPRHQRAMAEAYLLA